MEVKIHLGDWGAEMTLTRTSEDRLAILGIFPYPYRIYFS